MKSLKLRGPSANAVFRILKMRALFLLFVVLVGSSSAQSTNSGSEQQARQAVMSATETQFSSITNLLNTADQKFAKLINDVMLNYVNARVLGPDHIWNTTKNLVDQAGLSEADKDQFYALLAEALNAAPSAGSTPNA